MQNYSCLIRQPQSDSAYQGIIRSFDHLHYQVITLISVTTEGRPRALGGRWGSCSDTIQNGAPCWRES